MAKADVTALVDTFSVSQADAARVDADYDELVRLLSYTQSWTFAAVLITPTPGTSEYALPAEGTRIVALFYGGRQLSKESRTSLSALSPNWRDHKGVPIAYVVEDQEALTFRLYPTPTQRPDDHIPGTTTFGTSYPDRNIVAVMAERRTNMPVWTEVPLALELVLREFLRDTTHRNAVFATAAGKMAASLLSVVGS